MDFVLKEYSNKIEILRTKKEEHELKEIITLFEELFLHKKNYNSCENLLAFTPPMNLVKNKK